MSNKNTITRTELLNRISRPGAIIMAFGTLTDTKARKTNNPYGVIMKTARFTGIVGADYEKMVQRQEVKATGEKTFETNSLPWGEWVKGQEGKLISHKGGIYLRISFPPNERQVKARVTYWTQSRKFIKAKDALPFIPVPKMSERQKEVGVTEEKEVKVRTFNLSSIRYVKIDGKLLKVKGE